MNNAITQLIDTSESSEIKFKQIAESDDGGNAAFKELKNQLHKDKLIDDETARKLEHDLDYEEELLKESFGKYETLVKYSKQNNERNSSIDILAKKKQELLPVISKLEDGIVSQMSSIRNLDNQIAAAKSKIDDLRNSIHSKTTLESQIKLNIENLKTDPDSLQRKIKAVELKIETLKSNFDGKQKNYLKNLQDLNSQLNRQQVNINLVNEGGDKIRGDIKEEESRWNQANQNYNDLRSRNKSKEEISRYYQPIILKSKSELADLNKLFIENWLSIFEKLE